MTFTDFRNDLVSGFLGVDHDGDIDVDAGVALRRKLVVRRILTTPGAFYHLPGYGVGIQSKALVNAGDLLRLQSRIRDQLARETSLRVDSVQVSSLAPGTYLISVVATFLSEGRIVVELRVSDSAEQFEVSFG